MHVSARLELLGVLRDNSSPNEAIRIANDVFACWLDAPSVVLLK